MIVDELGLSWSVWPYALLAAIMVGANLGVFLLFFPRRAAQAPPSFSRAILVAYFICASPLFWLGALATVLSPSAGTAQALLLGLGIMMAAPGVWMIGAALPIGERPIRRDNPAWPALLSVAVAVNELLMGLVFVVATAAPGAAVVVAGTDAAGAFALATNSVWFFWAMLVNMVVFLFWVPIARPERLALLALAASAAVGPLVVVVPLDGLVGMAVVMTVGFLVLFESLARRPAVSHRYLWTVLGVAGGFTGMAATQLYYVLGPPTLDRGIPFAAFTFTMMAAELFLVARAAIAGPEVDRPPIPWVRRPRELTLLLGLAFVSEWFMAAGFLAVLAGPVGFALPPVTGSGLALAASAGQFVARLVAIVGSVTASPYFLGLMGLEMGTLVAVRIRSTGGAEQRARLGLALGAFAVYTVAAPTLVGSWSSFPGSWPNVGAFGPASAALAPAVLGSYAVFVALALLFGRRSYCSVLCPSAVMYGGTFGQRLIPTLRESPTARHQVLGDRWRRIPTALGYSSWALLGVVTTVSAWNASGGRSFLVGSLDVATLYSVAIWNVLWYAFFIAIPYVGMSPCRTWGWCSTGTLVGAVSRLGFYQKEALDVSVCRACRTHECGKGCEVGLVDLPVALARTGRYRSLKCVGSGDCEEVCPYGNLVSRDVRDAVRRRLGLPDRFRDRRPHPRASLDLPTVLPLAGPSSSDAPRGPGTVNVR